MAEIPRRIFEHAAVRRASAAVRPILRFGMDAASMVEEWTAPSERAAYATSVPRGASGNQVMTPNVATLARRRSLPRAGSGPRASLRDRPRILLFNPPKFRGITVSRIFRSEYLFVEDNHVAPMDLGYFAAAARADADVTIVDANAEDLDEAQAMRRVEEARPDLMVVRGIIDILEHELEVPRRYEAKNPHVTVILASRGVGGAEELAFEEFPFLDGIATGEIDAFAEELAAGVSLDAIGGMSTPGEPAGFIRVVEDLDRHPIPDLDRMPPLWGSGYRLPYYGVRSGYFLTTSRGCPYACTFCMVGGVDERPFRYRRRDPENVVEEVRRLARRFAVRDFYVLDEIFTNPHGQTVSEAFAKAQVDLHWLCEGKPDLATRPVLQAMRRGGCKTIYYGIESGDDRILRDVQKGHTVADARRALRLTREEGIQSAAYVMLGFPNESWRTYWRLVRFLLDTRPNFVRYGFLAPYPITVLHRQMKAAGLLEFERQRIDRRISPYHDAAVAAVTRHLGRFELKLMDALFKQAFAAELTAAPPPSHLRV